MNGYEDVYRDLCLALAGRAGEVDWGAFSDANWEALVVIACQQGVAPLLYRAISMAEGAFPIGAAGWSSLAAEYYRVAAQNALLLAELERLQAALAQANVEVLPLKGAALVPWVYPEAALRPMNDLDFWVPPAQVGRALRVARSIGYALEKITYHAMLQGGPGEAVTLELHWTLPGSEGAPWPSLEIGQEVFHLLYLAAHLILQHPGETSRLIWYCDLDLLVRRYGTTVEWDALRRQAEALGWVTALYWALRGAQERLGTPVPAKWLLSLGDSCPPPPTVETQRHMIRRWMVQAFWALPATARLAMAASFLFPSPAYLRWRYHPRPQWLWPLGYLRRWGEMARDVLDENE